MNRKYSLLLALALLLANSCVDPLDLGIDAAAERLVVDGMITDEPGPYTVRLSRSKPYNTYADSWSAVETGATVSISNNQGGQETLTETAPGVYQTSAGGLQGQLGHTYTLHITTQNGSKYTSAPETLQPVPELDSLYFDVQPQQVLNEEDNLETVYVVNIYADAQDPAAMQNYYLWQWQNTFQVSTQPWDYSEKVRGVRVPMPKECCKTCWVTRFTDKVNILSDRLVNGGAIKRYRVLQVPVTEQAFGTKYHVAVQQLSISAPAYEYWRILKAQIENGGSIQDPPPAIITGNISSVTNLGERVLGFFGASAVSTKTLSISRDDLGVAVQVYVFPGDCRVIQNSTTEIPSFW